MNAIPVPMKHIIWPIDRSIPPDTMTTVMLMARMPVVETCMSTLAMFRGLMNATLAMLKPRTKISSTRMTARIVASSARKIGPFSRRE